MNTPLFFWIKVVISGFLIASISTLAKKEPRWAALLTALPLMTFLSLIWIYVETKDMDLLSRYTKDVLVWVLPSLLFFVAAIYLFRWKVPFVLSMTLATLFLFGGIYFFQKLGIIK